MRQLLGQLFDLLQSRSRRDRYDTFIATLKPTRGARILDIGAETQERSASDNILEKSYVLYKGARVKYAFIHANRDRFPVLTMCWTLKVAPSGFYAWIHKSLSDRAIEDERLLGLIRESYTASGGIYGSPMCFWIFAKRGNDSVGSEWLAS